MIASERTYLFEGSPHIVVQLGALAEVDGDGVLPRRHAYHRRGHREEPLVEHEIVSPAGWEWQAAAAARARRVRNDVEKGSSKAKSQSQAKAKTKGSVSSQRVRSPAHVPT